MSARASKLLHHLRRLAEPTASDAVLLARWREQRDEDAFAALVARHGPMVLGVCRRVLGDVQDAEDVFQAVFLVLARKPAAVRRPDALPSFLYGVALRLARKSQGAARRQRGKALPLAGELIDPQPQALDVLSGRELLNVLDEEIARLPQEYRLPLLLCLLQDRSLEEAAQILGWRPGSVRGRLARGRARLRERLALRGLCLPVGALAVLTPAVLPERLRAGCLRVLTTPPSPAVSALAGGPLAPLKLKVLSLGLILAAVGLGAGLPFLSTPAPQTPCAAAGSGTSPKTEASSPRTDRYGDPLPPGAIARLGTIQQRFDTWDLAWSADGRTIITCNRDRSIRWWDARTGKVIKSRDWPGETWRRVHISPDAKVLAAEEMKGLLTIWDMETRKCLHTFDGYRWMGDYPFAFSADSSLLAVANNDEGQGILHLIELGTGRRRTLGMHLGAGMLAISPDRKRYFSFGYDRKVRCWDIAAAREVWKMEGWPSGIALSPDGRTLAVGVCNQHPPGLRFLDAATGRARSPDRLIKGWGATILQYSPRGDVLAIPVWDSAQSTSATVIWDEAANKERRRLLTSNGHFSPDGKRFAGWNNCVLQCWDVSTGKQLFPDTTGHGHTIKPTVIAYSPDGKLLASASLYEGTLRIWDVRSGQARHILNKCVGYPDMGGVQVSPPTEPLYLFFTADSKQLVVADIRGGVGIWDTMAGRRLRHFQLHASRHADRREHLLALQLAGDSETLSAVTCLMPNDTRESAGPIYRSRWHLSTGKRLGTVMEMPYGHFKDLSPDGRLFVSRQESLYDFDNQLQLRTSAPESPGSLSGQLLSFSPDGTLVAAQLHQIVTKEKSWESVARGVQVWELSTGAPLARLPASQHGWLAFSPDNRLLALAGPDDIRIWDVASKKEVYRRTVAGHLLSTYGSPLRFSPDGKTLATPLEDTTVTLWDLSALKHEPAHKAPLSPRQLEALWFDLAGPDAARAYAAAEELAARPGQTIPLLRERLRPVAPLAAETLKKLIAGLDSDDFAEREAATRRLAEQGRLAEAVLRQALTGQPSLEMRRRIEALLAQQERLSPARLRALRSVRVLERAASAEARELLETLAGGATSTRLAKAARAALRRLR